MSECGYIVNTGSDGYLHSFGGQTPCDPICPNCNKPLMLYLSLDSSDPRLSIEVPGGILRLYYCMRCSLCWYDFAYSFNEEGGIDLVMYYKGPVDYDKGEFEDHFPEKGISLEEIPEEFHELIVKISSVDREEITPDDDVSWNQYLKSSERWINPFNQVIGFPFLYQGASYPYCLTCRNNMRFVACLFDDADRGIKINPDYGLFQVMFWYCQGCRMVVVKHSSV